MAREPAAHSSAPLMTSTATVGLCTFYKVVHQYNYALSCGNHTITKGRAYLQCDVLGMRCVHYLENIRLLLCATFTGPWRRNCDAESGGRWAGQHVSRSNSKGSVNFRLRLSIYHQSGPSSGMIGDNIWRKTTSFDFWVIVTRISKAGFFSQCNKTTLFAILSGIPNIVRTMAKLLSVAILKAGVEAADMKIIN